MKYFFPAYQHTSSSLAAGAAGPPEKLPAIITGASDILNLFCEMILRITLSSLQRNPYKGERVKYL